MSAAYPKEIPALTSLRYFAASWVVFFHLSNFVASDVLLRSPIVLSGYLGVDFFFVLSGFVLTHVYYPQIESGRFDYWMFVSRRLARIYPLHLVTLGGFLILGVLAARGVFKPEPWLGSVSFKGLDHQDLVRAVGAHLTLIHAWGSTSHLMFNLPSWSISAEWFAYLMFPVFILVRRLPPRREPAKLAAVIVLFLLMAVGFEVALKGELTRLTWNMGILRIIPEFLIGMSLHRFGEKWTAGRMGSLIGIGGALGIVILSVVLAGALPRLAILLAVLTVLGLAGIVLFAADADRCGGLGFLDRAFPVLLGEISYSVYMIHLGVAIVLFDIVAPWWRPHDTPGAVLTVVGTLVLITALSWLTYRFIEIPGRRWIVRQAGRLAPR